MNIFRLFQKSLTYNEINEFVSNEGFQFLILEVYDNEIYGFDMRDSFQSDMVEMIVSQCWTYAYILDKINGWKIPKYLPKGALDHIEWTRFVKNEEEDINMQNEDNSMFVHNKEEPYQYESLNSDNDNKNVSVLCV